MSRYRGLKDYKCVKYDNRIKADRAAMDYYIENAIAQIELDKELKSIQFEGFKEQLNKVFQQKKAKKKTKTNVLRVLKLLLKLMKSTAKPRKLNTLLLNGSVTT